MSTVRLSAALLLALLLPAPSWAAGEPSARAIMEKADTAARAPWETTHMEMELIDSSGEISRRSIVWYFQNAEGANVSVMKFLNPANVRSVGIMVAEPRGAENAIWHYLPATRNVRRISAEYKQNRFMGTELVFEDFEGLKTEKYDYSIVDTQPCAGTRSCWRIEARASDPGEAAASGYSRKIYWIDRDADFIARCELFDRSGGHIKTYDMEGVRPVDGWWRPRVQTMTNHTNGRKTRLVEGRRSINASFDRYYVSHQYLRSD